MLHTFMPRGRTLTPSDRPSLRERTGPYTMCCCSDMAMVPGACKSASGHVCCPSPHISDRNAGLPSASKEGQMRSRIIVGSLLLLGVFVAGTIATSGDGVAPPRQWGIATFTDPVLVTDQILMGSYLIVHDDAKMERGEACTSFYRFDAVKGPQEEVLSFHCTPATRKAAD